MIDDKLFSFISRRTRLHYSQEGEPLMISFRIDHTPLMSERFSLTYLAYVPVTG